MADFTTEAHPGLAKPPFKFNGGLVNIGLIALVAHEYKCLVTVQLLVLTMSLGTIMHYEVDYDITNNIKLQRYILVYRSYSRVDLVFISWTALQHGKQTPKYPWWRHQMETFSALLAFCAGNSPVPVNSPHKGQWRGALMFSLICARINDWVNNREAGDLRRHRGHYDVNVISLS